MRRKARRSVLTISSMSGYWTLTATSRPSLSRATCTCPIEAEAIGVAIELGEDFVGRAPAELLAQTGLDVLVGPGRHLILQPFELAAKGLGQEVGHDADELADLDEQALQLDHRLLDPAGVAPVGGLGDSARAGPDMNRRLNASHRYEAAICRVVA